MTKLFALAGALAIAAALSAAPAADSGERLAWHNWANFGIGIPYWNDWRNGWKNWGNNWKNGWNNWGNGWNNY